MAKYTAEEIKAQTTVKWWPLRNCGICFAPVGYRFSSYSDTLVWDGSCDCNSIASQRQSSWDEIARTINMNSEATQQMMLAELRGEQSGRDLG